MKGTVKWFNNEKGYGFIDYSQNEDIFVHYSAINQEGYKTLKEGEMVEYTLIETAKGNQAINVKEINFVIRDVKFLPHQSEVAHEFEINPTDVLFNAYDITEKNKLQHFSKARNMHEFIQKHVNL